MRLQIYKNPDDKNTKIGLIEIKNELARVWYNEMMRRFKELSNCVNEKHKQVYLKNNNIYDLDESFETWTISINHLWEMLKFINNK